MQRYKEINLFNPLINEYTHSKFPITHIYIHIFVLTSPLFHFLHLTIEGNNRSNRILIDPPLEIEGSPHRARGVARDSRHGEEKTMSVEEKGEVELTVAPTYIDARKAKARRLWPGFRKDGGDCRSPADSHVELFSTLFSKLRHLLSPLRLATRNLPFCDPSVPPHTYIFYIYIYRGKFLLENEKFSEYLRARERVYTCVQRDVQPECIHALRHRARRY